MRAASDVGGTFTDLVWYDYDEGTDTCGKIKTTKTDTTPPEFEQGVMDSLGKVKINPQELNYFAHGSTVIINAITERKGARTALITTRGFRDVLEIARGNRPDLFNLNFQKPAPFVERHLRAELEERTDYLGTVLSPVDLLSLEEILAYFKSESVEAIAICFLHAYMNSENEHKTAQAIKTLWPEVSVLASHEISREWREYERTSTTVLSAYVHPVAEKYIDSLEQKLAAGGFKEKTYMMQSNGGIATVRTARANPISMVESGPASGIYAAAELSKVIGEPNLIVLDIGGTTAKCSLIEDGRFKVVTEYCVEKDRKTPGYPIQTPVLDIVEIGNGGGSIAWVDEGGKLHVGPQSAAADPGPAAYGRGGEKPTTTDANLVLGRIDPDNFAGGEIMPDMDAVKRAFLPLQEKLGMSLEEVARGVIRIANANMVNALRLVSVNKGYDPREFTLMAFGGGGAMHAVALAEELKVPRVIVPVNSAVFSAWGMLLTDLRKDYVQTRPTTAEQANVETMTAVFTALQSEAETDFVADGIDTQAHPINFEYYADMRYEGQEHTVSVPFPFEEGCINLKTAVTHFHEAHHKLYTYRLDLACQIVNFHLVAKAMVPKPELVKTEKTGRKLAQTMLDKRRVDFDKHGKHETTIYDGLKLEAGMELQGPAIVQEPSVTLVVSPDQDVTVDEYGNYHVDLSRGYGT